MTKFEAIKELPTSEKISMSKVLDQWIINYEAGSYDNDPAAWFEARTSQIATDLKEKHIVCDLREIGIVAVQYYLSF
jgi:hypothetical protein